ncbi:hypothetical protein LZ30DRAFT_683508 [Colletotrichum cereale]|nr:hypothetical protein LZ30DRAFT_683508 [Colletotrichum cereale]
MTWYSSAIMFSKSAFLCKRTAASAWLSDFRDRLLAYANLHFASLESYCMIVLGGKKGSSYGPGTTSSGTELLLHVHKASSQGRCLVVPPSFPRHGLGDTRLLCWQIWQTRSLSWSTRNVILGLGKKQLSMSGIWGLIDLHQLPATEGMPFVTTGRPLSRSTHSVSLKEIVDVAFVDSNASLLAKGPWSDLVDEKAGRAA